VASLVIGVILMSSKELIREFLERGGVIERCDPEPDPPVIIKPRYGSAQKNILWRAISRGGNKQAEEVLFGMAAVNNKFRIRCRSTHFAQFLHCCGCQCSSVNLSSTESFYE